MLSNNKNISLYFLILIFIFHSCAPTLPVVAHKKDMSVPEDFPKFSKEKIEGLSLADKGWKNYFVDKNLNSLIDIALKNNQELNILAQEVSIANNEVMARKGEYLPKLDFKAGYETEKVGEFTHQGATDSTTEFEPGRTVPENLHNHRVGLFSSWEIDIWKKLRNATKSSYYKYLSSIEGRKYIITSLVAEVANTYYELMALDKQLEIVNNYVDVLQRAKKLVDLQQQAARVTSLAVKRFEAEVLKNQGRKFELLQKITVTENKINVLLGRFPQPVIRSTEDFISLRPSIVNPGVPSKLLDNRPDVIKAALKLKAAKLDVKVAKARFYPSLSIEAGAGYEAFNSEHLFESSQSIFYNLGANLTAPLLNRKAIKADYFSANNKQIQALYNYEYTLVKAYSEVVNQLSMIKNLGQEYEIKSQQVAALTESANISTILFKAARVDYVEALITQRDSLETQVELVEVKKEQLVSYVNLYKALGGGWREK